MWEHTSSPLAQNSGPSLGRRMSQQHTSINITWTANCSHRGRKKDGGTDEPSRVLSVQNAKNTLGEVMDGLSSRRAQMTEQRFASIAACECLPSGTLGLTLHFGLM